MGSDFFGLHVGLSALYTARRSMEITSQNITNANTEGYSRQRVLVSANGPGLTPSLHTRTLSMGAGVKIEGVQRTRDQFMEARAVAEYSTLSFMKRSQAVLNRVELIFIEPSESGIQSQLSDFWAGWEDLANQPGSLAARAQLVERAQTVATSVNAARNELAALWQTSNQQLQTVTTGVNAVAQRVADLNAAIKRATSAGISPNELLDQRDQLAIELASLVGGQVRETDLGMIDVIVGGSALVRGEVFEKLEMHIPVGSNITSSADPNFSVQLRWQKDGFPAVVTSGEAGGLLDVVNRMLPGYRASIDGVAAKLAADVNAQHDKGLDLDGFSVTGVPTAAGASPPAESFFTFSVAAGLQVGISSHRRVAAALPTPAVPDPLAAAPGLDGTNALAMADIGAKPDGADNDYRTLIIQIGVDAQTTYRRFEIQNSITRQVDAARDAESGVSIDEELANMVAFQHTYAAASRMITAIDQMLDRLINGTGLVGR